MKNHIKIRNISKTYPDGTKALKNINMDIKESEIVVLLGASGCGKSTLLRTIGGLEKKTEGEIYFYDDEISNVPVEQRDIGFVFQNYALFPTMTVEENIKFGIKLRKLPKKEMKDRLDYLLELFDLEELADKKPGQLSGGQQQRVAIARVLAIQPTVLLMDEPLTALDAKLKEHLRVELALMLRRLGITTIYVTHDQAEAMAIADRIAIMNKGVIEQIDTPEAIYSSPKTDFIAQFIGKINRIEGKLYMEADKKMVDLGFDKIPYTGTMEPEVDSTISVFIRPEDLSISKDDEGVPAEVVLCSFLGGYCHILAKMHGQEVFFEEANTVNLKQGENIKIEVIKEKIVMI